MSAADTGGPAFPAIAEYIQNEGGFRVVDGMTLRDYFAAKAMQGLLLDDNGDFSDPNWLAQHAYRFADAMIAARKS